MQKTISILENDIHHIGSEMVNCQGRCCGVYLNRAKGYIPRYLILETDARETQKLGVIVVGLNPGTAYQKDEKKSFEQEWYVENAPVSYDRQIQYWNGENGGRRKAMKEKSYYARLRNFIDLLEITGPILWTECVKCQNDGDMSPGANTFITCMSLYLDRELDLVPEWKIIAVGMRAYEELLCRYPGRIIIGVPHVTGSMGLFPTLLSTLKKKSAVRHELQTMKSGTVWIKVGRDASVEFNTTIQKL